MPASKECPTLNHLRLFLSGIIDDALMREYVSQHLAECTTCQARANELSGMEKDIRNAPPSTPKTQPVVDDAVTPAMQDGKTVRSSHVGKADPSDATGTPDLVDLASASLLAPAQEPDEIGRMGAYSVLKLLGKGGMGSVYLARDVRLNRPVALKIMLPKFVEIPSARARFLREARTVAKLRNDYIVNIHQVDEDRGIPFFVMEYLEGMPLDKFLGAGGKLSVPQIVKLGREVALGLAAAHAQGLIHRDIKPGNLWLDRLHEGRAKILDFGLARPFESDIHITEPGTIVGTPAYMAPEQARGDRQLDPRVDLFGLGCVLYRLTTGEIPFRADHTLGVLTALAINTPKTPIQINDQIPLPLSDLIMKLLQKEPENRPASAREVLNQLQAFTFDDSSAPPMPSLTEEMDRLSSKVALTKSLGSGPTEPAIIGEKLAVRDRFSWRPWWIGMITLTALTGIAVGLAMFALNTQTGWREDNPPVPKAAFEAIFNGVDLSGWQHRVHDWAPVPDRISISIVDGALQLTGKSAGAGYLWTDRNDIADFHLKTEFNLGKGVNSGIFFRVTPDEKQWNGFEVNLLHDMSRLHVGTLESTTPGVNTLELRPIVIEPDTWHSLEIFNQGNYISVKVDGKTTAEQTLDKQVASKHNRMGRLGLEVHPPGAVVSFRNMIMRDLPPLPDGVKAIDGSKAEKANK